MIQNYEIDEEGYVNIPVGAKVSVLSADGRIEIWAESGPKPLLERRHVIIEHHSDKPSKGYEFVGTILKYGQVHHVFMRSRLAEIMADDAKVGDEEAADWGVFEGEDGIFSRPVQTSANNPPSVEHVPSLPREVEKPPIGVSASTPKPETELVKGAVLEAGDEVFHNDGLKWSVVVGAAPYLSRTTGTVDTMLTMQQIRIVPGLGYLRVSKKPLEPELGHWTDQQPESLKTGGSVGPGSPEGPPAVVGVHMKHDLLAPFIELVRRRLKYDSPLPNQHEAFIRMLAVLGAAHTPKFVPCAKCGEDLPPEDTKGLRDRVDIELGKDLPPWCRSCVSAIDEAVAPRRNCQPTDAPVLSTPGNYLCTDVDILEYQWQVRFTVKSSEKEMLGRRFSIPSNYQNISKLAGLLTGGTEVWLKIREQFSKLTGKAYYTHAWSILEPEPLNPLPNKAGTLANFVGIYRCTNVTVSRNGGEWIAQFDCDQGPIFGSGLVLAGRYKEVSPDFAWEREDTLWLVVGTPGNYWRWSKEEPKP